MYTIYNQTVKNSFEKVVAFSGAIMSMQEEHTIIYTIIK